MPDVLYVGLQDDNKIASFGIDAGSGKLTPKAETPAAGAPSVFAVSPDRRILYVGYRGTPAIESCRIDSASGALTSLGRVATEHPPTYLATDRAGKYLLSAYYQGGYAAVHALGTDGAVRGPALDRQNTAPGAHAILTDPSNRFAFVPHIARQNDNVLEPPKNIPGPNFIAQFRFDPASGRLSPNAPFKLEPSEPIGPRHYCFHPTLDIAYFSDEQGCSVTAYRLDRASGTLVRRGHDSVAARGRHRAQYLLADLPDAVGPVPLCRQPRPQQHRRVRGRPGDRAPHAGRARADRGGPHRLRPRFRPGVSCSQPGRRPAASPRTGSTARPAR